MPDFPDEPMGGEGMSGEEPMPDMGGGEPMPDMGGEESMGGNEPWDDEESFDAGVEADEESDPKNFIQQLSGKLAQSLRDYNGQNETDLELEKFALNSVISATHSGKMDPNDQGDIIEKIKTAGTDEYETKDEKEGEDDGEDDMSFDAEPTGAMPSNPASEAPPAGGGGMGESFQRKEVFADPKLGVPDEESNFHPLKKESHEDDFEKLNRSVEHGIDPETGEDEFDFIFDEGDNNITNDLDINNKKDTFVGDNMNLDFNIQNMIQDYLNTQNGFQQEEDMNEPAVKPDTKPTTKPSTTPRPNRRHAPYRIDEQPAVSPKPKASK
jgi:hypothetical protein